MKRILIVNNNMCIGGVQKALLNLLKEVSTNYEITLLLFQKGGDFLMEVPGNVHVMTSTPAFQTWGITQKEAKRSGLLLPRTFYAAVTRIVGRKWAVRLQVPFQKKIRGYDIAISFLHSGDEHQYYGGYNEFVLQCVDAAEKIGFIHCDYSKINAQSAYNASIYQQFDKIATCSEGCKETFLKVFPEFSEKTFVVHNCHAYSEIQKKAQDMNVDLPNDRLNILTVARFGKEKGIPRAIRAIAALGSMRQKMHYYVIGDGIEYKEAKALIAEFGLNDTVSLLGEMENPYGYMKAADMLLIPSFSEAAPMVVGEAASLGTPILTTRTSSAEEMVRFSGYGWVCENSQSGICKGIKKILECPAMLHTCAAFLQKSIFSNENAIKEFESIV